MWRNTVVCVFLLCFSPYLGHAQYDLGQQISQQVQDSLRGLDHLGSDIDANVQQSLRAAGLDTLGSRISADVERGLAGLDDLGPRIENQVHNSLMPVYAIAIRNDMAHGVGGTTIATYNGKISRSFIIKNGARSVCSGNIKGSECEGTLTPFTIADREDYCYASSYAIVNNNICLSSSAINVIINNNIINCQSTDGSSTIVLTRKEFEDLCGNVSPGQIVYKYYANPNDPRAIPIPNENPYVTCRNNEPGVCEFEGDNAAGHNSVSAGSGTVVVNGGSIISSGGSNVIFRNN